MKGVAERVQHHRQVAHDIVIISRSQCVNTALISASFRPRHTLNQTVSSNKPSEREMRKWSRHNVVITVAVLGAEMIPPPSSMSAPLTAYKQCDATQTAARPPAYLSEHFFLLLLLLGVARSVFLLSRDVPELDLDDVFLLAHGHLVLFRPHFSPSPSPTRR